MCGGWLLRETVSQTPRAVLRPTPRLTDPPPQVALREAIVRAVEADEVLMTESEIAGDEAETWLFRKIFRVRVSPMAPAALVVMDQRQRQGLSSRMNTTYD